MDQYARANLLFSQSVCAMLRGFGMISENLQRVHRGESMAYTEEMFKKVIIEFGIDWNDAISQLRE